MSATTSITPSASAVVQLVNADQNSLGTLGLSDQVKAVLNKMLAAISNAANDAPDTSLAATVSSLVDADKKQLGKLSLSDGKRQELEVMFDALSTAATAAKDQKTLTDGTVFEQTDDGGKLTLPGGAVITTSSDPAVTTTLPDHTAIKTKYDTDGKPAGASITLPDGTIATTSTHAGVASTTIQSKKDGTVVLNPGETKKLTDGTTIAVGLDGRATITKPDHTTIVTKPTGETTTTLPNKADGPTTKISSDGSVSVMSATGSETVTTPDGNQEVASTGKKFADGSIVRVDANTGATSRTLGGGGPKITFTPPDADGKSAVDIVMNNGTTITTSLADKDNPDAPSPTGTVINVAGGTQVTIADGKVQYYNEKHEAVNVVPGAGETTLPDGTKIKLDTLGTATVTLKDGTVNVITKSGDRNTTLPDGKTKIHLYGQVESVDPADPTGLNLLLTGLDGSLDGSATVKKLSSNASDPSSLETTSDGIMIRTLADNKKITLRRASAENPLPAAVLSLAPPNDGYGIESVGNAATGLTVSILLPDGSRLQPRPGAPATDSTPATPAGFVIIAADGTESAVQTDGKAGDASYKLVGDKFEITLPGGVVTTVGPDGTTTTVDPKVPGTIYNADGTRQVKQADGSSQVLDVEDKVIDTSTVTTTDTTITEKWGNRPSTVAILQQDHKDMPNLNAGVFKIDNVTGGSTFTATDGTRLETANSSDPGTIFLKDGATVKYDETNGWTYVSASGQATALADSTTTDGKKVFNDSTTKVIGGVTFVAGKDGQLAVNVSTPYGFGLELNAKAPPIVTTYTGVKLKYDGTPA